MAVVAYQPQAIAPRAPDTQQLLEAFLSGRSPETARAYRRDLQDFATFAAAGSPAAAATLLLGYGHGAANLVGLRYRNDMQGRGLAPATVNRRLAALRSLVKLGRTLGMVGWELDVSNVRAEAYRETAGPGLAAVKRILDGAGAETGRKARRDLAVVRLLFDLALRRCEVTRLDVGDYDREAKTVAVRGKGKTEKVRLSLPERTWQALEGWTEVRPAGGVSPPAGPGMPRSPILPDPSPLFVTFARNHKDKRLTGKGVYLIVRRRGEALGVRARPHGIRHSSISAALEATGGDVRRVQRFSRHAKIDTLMVYDDHRRDDALEVARLVANL